MHLVRAVCCLVLLLPGFSLAQVATSDVDAMFTREALVYGARIDKVGCMQLPTAAWIAASGEEFCARYYVSPGQKDAAEAVVYLEGDVLSIEYGWIASPATVIPARAEAFASILARQTGLTAMFLARMGTFGSSGHHNDRHTLLEAEFTTAALDKIKERHGIETFHVVGQSGGSNLALALMTFRNDLGCVVLGAGALFWPEELKTGNSPRSGPRSLFDAEHVASNLETWGGRRIFVVSDPGDDIAPLSGQERFVKAMREHGRAVEHILVRGAGSNHHLVQRSTFGVAAECVAGRDSKDIAMRWHHPPATTAEDAAAAISQSPALTIAHDDFFALPSRGMPEQVRGTRPEGREDKARSGARQQLPVMRCPTPNCGAP